MIKIIKAQAWLGAGKNPENQEIEEKVCRK